MHNRTARGIATVLVLLGSAGALAEHGPKAASGVEGFWKMCYSPGLAGVDEIDSGYLALMPDGRYYDLCFVQLFIVSNRADTWYFANNNARHFAFDADERFLPIYQFAAEDNTKITHLDDFAERFLAKCTLGQMISKSPAAAGSACPATNLRWRSCTGRACRVSG